MRGEAIGPHLYNERERSAKKLIFILKALTCQTDLFVAVVSFSLHAFFFFFETFVENILLGAPLYFSLLIPTWVILFLKFSAPTVCLIQLSS